MRTGPVKIGMVAGEASGDQLGGPLLKALRRYFPDAEFAGIGGPQMQAQGFKSLFALERLSVMGFVDPLKRLPELLRMRRDLCRYFLDHRFDLVLGIDAPDFNLGLELKLRRQGIATAHYVSPSVWAWRQGRVKKIARAVDHMLTLFPFEQRFYEQHQVPATFVGHPLADQFPLTPDRDAARAALGFAQHERIITLMPGSRHSEVAMMGNLFLQVAQSCREQRPDLTFVLPAASSARYAEIQELLSAFPALPVTLLDGQSHAAMTAADLVLMVSGTTTLEAMLLKKPMVVCYRMGNWSYALARRLVKTDFISLPNLLAGKPLVAELIQQQATRTRITEEVLSLLDDQERQRQLTVQFSELHQQLRRDASAGAARILSKMVKT